MKVSEKYASIWKQICDKILSIPQLSKLTLSIDNSVGWCVGASWYGENIISNDDYIHISPIEKCGREVYGTISYSIGLTDTYCIYKSYEEFEIQLNILLSKIE